MKQPRVVLFIDSADSEHISVALKINKKRHQKISRSKIHKAQTVLFLIDSLLKEHRLSASDLTSIRVNTGPGSFTSLRVGVAVANALGWSLGIPVNGQVSQPAIPVYGEKST